MLQKWQFKEEIRKSINILQELNYRFDNKFAVSIEYHQYEISDWLLDNYKCEEIPKDQTLNYYNENAFFFFFSNIENYQEQLEGQNIINLLCSQPLVNYEIIKEIAFFNPDLKKNNPIVSACDHKVVNKDLIELFVQKGVDVNEEIKGETALSVLCKNMPSNGKEIINLLMQNGAQINKKPLLLISIHNHHTDTVFLQFLIANQADINCYDEHGNVLEALCAQNPIDITALKILLDNGANPNVYKKELPLLISLCNKKSPDLKSIQLLLNYKADINITYKGNTCLYYVCSKKPINNELLGFLLDKGADPNKYETISPLEVVCNNEEIDLISLHLLIDHGANINQKFQNNDTLLSFLSQNKKDPLRYIKFIIEKYSDKLKFPEAWGETLVNLCKQKEIPSDLFNYILDNGADVNIGDPLSVILETNLPDDDVMELKNVRKLIQHGANPCTENIHDLLFCYKFQNMPLIKLFFDNCKDNEFCEKLFIDLSIAETPSKYKNRTGGCRILKIEKYLFDKFVDKSHCTKMLYDVISKPGMCYYQLSKMFLENGADPNYQEEDGNTTFWIYCRDRLLDEEILKLFADNGCDYGRIYQYQDKYRNKMIKTSPFYELLKNEKISNDLLLYVLAAPGYHTLPELNYIATICKDPKRNFAVLKAVYEHGAPLYKDYPLLKACNRETEDLEFVKFLVNNGLDANINPKIGSPLLIACKNEHHLNCEVIKFLIDNGANPNLGGFNLLKTAMENKHVTFEVIKCLVDHLNKENYSKEWIIKNVGSYEKEEIIEYLNSIPD